MGKEGGGGQASRLRTQVTVVPFLRSLFGAAEKQQVCLFWKELEHLENLSVETSNPGFSCADLEVGSRMWSNKSTGDIPEHTTNKNCGIRWAARDCGQEEEYPGKHKVFKSKQNTSLKVWEVSRELGRNPGTTWELLEEHGQQGQMLQKGTSHQIWQ